MKGFIRCIKRTGQNGICVKRSADSVDTTEFVSNALYTSSENPAIGLPFGRDLYFAAPLLCFLRILLSRFTPG